MGRFAVVLLAAVVAALQWSTEGSLFVQMAVERRVAVDAELAAVYQPSFAPLWVGPDGVMTPAAGEALQVLDAAADEGLDPGEYAVASLAWRRAPSAPGAEADAIARFDVELSRAVLRYLRHLHMGRVDPRDIGFTLTVPRDGHDFAALVRQASGGRVAELARAWAPRGPQYPALAAALRRYRTLAEFDTPFRVALTRPVHPGERAPFLAELHARLGLLGDTPPELSAPVDDLYAGAIVMAVQRFQARHGLEPDGVLGTRTVAHLQVPIRDRLRQLELGMERLRWLPHEADTRLILVNIPVFRLLAWDSVPPSGLPGFTTGTIVGRALSTQTPVFAASLTEVVFRPYWNVPTSIVRGEVLPKLARDPTYLVREQLELVAGQGDAAPVVEATPANLAGLRTGAVRLRQRPGPGNALGLIKFSFPNEHDVYLHGTPVQALFARSRRDFSHGCVRVEDPVGLAVWVLGAQDGWTRDRVVAAMHASVSSRVTLRAPVSVMLLYSTVSVRLDSGELVFADDIYQHDARLDRALRQRSGLAPVS